ncbi:hypothetical protein ABK040_004157 [Willaertia magna]
MRKNTNNNTNSKTIEVRKPYLYKSKEKRHYFINHHHNKENEYPLLRMVSAAIEIQRHIRGYLYRKGFQQPLTPQSQSYNNTKTTTIEQETLILNEYNEIYNKIIQPNNLIKNESNYSIFLSNYIPYIQSKFQQLITIFKFNKTGEYFNNKIFYISASLIQNKYKNYRKKLFLFTGSKLYFFRKNKKIYYNLLHHSAFKIQFWWKNYINREIFIFYKHLISFKENLQNPSTLLKSINPKEASLLDSALGAHVKFRLGGNYFPPNIYYKIFIHFPIIDINSFAPRNYANERKLNTELPINKLLIDKGSDHNGTIDNIIINGNRVKELLNKEWEYNDWYHRDDRNAWRHVNSNDFISIDDLNNKHFNNLCNFTILDLVKKKSNRVLNNNSINNNPPTIYIPPKKKKDLLKKKRRKRRLEWLLQLRKMDVNIENQTIPLLDNNEDNELHKFTLNMKEKDVLDQLDEELLDDDLDKEMNDILDWCSNLDYYKYVHDWKSIATTLGSDYKVNNTLRE